MSDNQPQTQCPSKYITASHGGGTDYVQCQKPAGHHKRKEHTFSYSRPRKGETERWSDGEAATRLL